jgi:hypothetical protein
MLVHHDDKVSAHAKFTSLGGMMSIGVETKDDFKTLAHETRPPLQGKGKILNFRGEFQGFKTSAKGSPNSFRTLYTQ